jgi:hypothetical protein
MDYNDIVKKDIMHNFGDKDQDGYINILDCNPNDPEQDGILGDIRDYMSSVSRSISRSTRQRISSGYGAVREGLSRGPQQYYETRQRIKRAEPRLVGYQQQRVGELASLGEKGAHVKELEKERLKLKKLETEKRQKLEGYTTFPLYEKSQQFSQWWDRTIVPKELRPDTPKAIKPLAEFGIGVIRSPGQVAGFYGMVPTSLEFVARDSDEFAAAVIPGTIVSAKGMYRHAKEEPLQFLGETVGQTALTLGAGKAIKAAPIRPAVGRAKLPHGEAVGIGIRMKKGAYVDYVPVITKGKGGIKPLSIGKPKIKGRVFSDIPTEIRTPLEVSIAKRAVPSEIAKITEGRAVRSYTVKSGVKPKKLTPVIDETLKQHGLSKSTKTVVKLLKEEKADLHGSVMQKAAGKQVGEMGLKRIPRDFDVRVSNLDFARKAVEQINKAEGKQVVVLKGNKVLVKQSGKKLFDIHLKDDVPYGGTGEEFIGYGLKEEPYIRTAEGIRTTTLSRQATRKLTAAQEITAMERKLVTESGLHVRGRIAPEHAGRIKDIADYYFAEKAGIAGLKLKHKSRSASAANVHLEKWLDSWGPEVKTYVHKLYKKDVNVKGGEKAWLGSYEKMPYPKSPSKSKKLVTQKSYIPVVKERSSSKIFDLDSTPSNLKNLRVKEGSIINSINEVDSRTGQVINKGDQKSVIDSKLERKQQPPSKIIDRKSVIDSKLERKQQPPSKIIIDDSSIINSINKTASELSSIIEAKSSVIESKQYIPPSDPYKPIVTSKPIDTTIYRVDPIVRPRVKPKKRRELIREEKEVEDIYRKRKYQTLTPQEFLKL